MKQIFLLLVIFCVPWVANAQIWPIPLITDCGAFNDTDSDRELLCDELVNAQIWPIPNVPPYFPPKPPKPKDCGAFNDTDSDRELLCDELIKRIETGDKEKVVQLVSEGVDLSLKDEQGYTALIIASGDGYIECRCGFSSL